MARIVKLQQNNETVYPKTVTEAVYSPEHGKTVDNVLKDLGNTGVSVFAEILAQDADIEIQTEKPLTMLGGDWCMPTHAEQEGLRDNCYWVRTSTKRNRCNWLHSI